MNIKIIFEMFSKWPTAASIAVMLYEPMLEYCWLEL